jgi:hypothetical protein
MENGPVLIQLLGMLQTLAALALVALLAPMQPLHANEKPPQGSKDASCIYSDNPPGFCKVKVDWARNQISIWHPATRESAKTMTYSGKCLTAGCILVGPDLGYPERTRVKITTISSEYISWRELNHNKAASSFRMTDYK